MIINRRTSLVLTLGLLATLLTVDAAQAMWRLSVFVGTRAQVANACGRSMDLYNWVGSDGEGYSLCVNPANSNTVSCSDSGICMGSWSDGIPDVTSGSNGGDGRGPRGKPLIAGVPSGSLSEPGTSYPLDPPEPGPNDDGYDGPIYN